MKSTYRSAFMAGLVAASCLMAGTVHASTATLVGDKIIGFGLFPSIATTVPVALTPNAVTVTDDATDTFGFGSNDIFNVDVNATSVTLTLPTLGTFFQPGVDCNCLLLAGLNFSDGSKISALTIEEATTGYTTGIGVVTPFTLATRTSFGTNALMAGFAFPTGPLSQALIDSDAESGEYVLINVGGSNLRAGDRLTIGFTTTGGTVIPDPNTPVVPLPASAWMLLAAMGGLIGMRRRTRA